MSKKSSPEVLAMYLAGTRNANDGTHSGLGMLHSHMRVDSAPAVLLVGANRHAIGRTGIVIPRESNSK